MPSIPTFWNSLLIIHPAELTHGAGEQKVTYETQIALATVMNSQPSLRVINRTVSEHFLLLDLDVEYPRLYEVNSEPLICSGGTEPNICVTGSSTGSDLMVLDITDPLNAVVLDVAISAESDGWSAVFACGDASKNYAIFEKDSCFQPSGHRFQ